MLRKRIVAQRCALLTAVVLASPVLSVATGLASGQPASAAVKAATVKAAAVKAAAVKAAAVKAAAVKAVADAQSAPDESTAAGIARAHGHPVTVLDSLSETSRVQAMPNGSFQLTVSSQPVRVHRGHDWVPVDSNLSNQNGSLSPQAAVVPVRFSAGGSGPLAQVQSPSGQWLAETWPAGKLPAPTVRGSAATYPDVLPGVDLVLTATVTGMSEVLVVKDASAAADPQLSEIAFGLNSGSLHATRQAGGTAVLKAADGTPQLVSAAATWWDSSSAGASPAGPGGLGVPAPVPGTFSDTRVTVNAAAAARAPRVTYPVYIDPTWTGDKIGWGFVDSAYRTTSYWKDAGASDAYQHVGYVDAAHSDDGQNHTTRSYWQMDVSAALGGTVSDAHFDTTEVYSYSCSARQVDLWTSSVAGPSTTWNTQPVPSTEVATATVAYGYNSSCPGHAVGFDVTSAVGRAMTAGSSVINLELMADNEGDVYGWKKFAAAASLTLTYNKPPAAPSSFGFTQPPVSCVTGSGRPAMNNNYPINLQATLSDPDQGDTMYGTLQVLNLPMTHQYWTTKTGWTSNNSVVGFTIPANTMIDGTTFMAQSWTTDNSGVVGPNSTACEGVIDDTPPPLPTVALASGSSTPSTVGQSTSLTISSNPSDGVGRFLYWWAPGTATGTPPAPVQGVVPNQPLPACGSFTAGVSTACPDAGGTATITVAPIDNDSTLWVTSVDKAGNISTDSTGQATSTPWYVHVAGDAADFESGQAWPTDHAATGSTVAAVNAPSSDVLTLNAATTWTTGQQVNGTSNSNVLTFNGTSSLATSPRTTDLTKPFTVAAWVYPTGTASRFYTAVSSDSGTPGSSSASGFDLQYYSGVSGNSLYRTWRFCLPNGTGAVVDCAVSATGQVLLNKWTFVAGQWDPVNHAIRLYLGGQPVSSSSHQSSATSTGQLVVGRAWWANATTDWWAGMVDSPIVTPSLSDGFQLNALMAAGPAGSTSFFQCKPFGSTTYSSCQ